MPHIFLDQPLDPLARSLAYIWLAGDKSAVRSSLNDLHPVQALVVAGLVAVHLDTHEREGEYETFSREVMGPLMDDPEQGRA